MRRSDISLAIMDIRTAWVILARPCDCGRHQCTLGEHIWDSTRNMTPGPRAHSYEPAMAGNGHPATDTDPPPDPTAALHEQLNRLYEQAMYACRNVTREIDRLRPDRYIPLPVPATDDMWCRNHLDLIGACEARYRGDLCRDCYELGLTYGTAPDRQCLEAIKDVGYKADRIINDWLERLPNKSPARKRRQRERERRQRAS